MTRQLTIHNSQFSIAPARAPSPCSFPTCHESQQSKVGCGCSPTYHLPPTVYSRGKDYLGGRTFHTSRLAQRRGVVKRQFVSCNLSPVLDGAAHDNSDYLVGDAARTRAAGRAAGPNRGPCATSAPPPTNPRHKEPLVAPFAQPKGVIRRHPGPDTSGSARCVLEPGHRINPRRRKGM